MNLLKLLTCASACNALIVPLNKIRSSTVPSAPDQMAPGKFGEKMENVTSVVLDVITDIEVQNDTFSALALIPALFGKEFLNKTVDNVSGQGEMNSTFVAFNKVPEENEEKMEEVTFIGLDSISKLPEENVQGQTSSAPVILGQVVPKNSFVAFDSSVKDYEEEIEDSDSYVKIIPEDLGENEKDVLFVAFDSAPEEPEEQLEVGISSALEINPKNLEEDEDMSLSEFDKLMGEIGQIVEEATFVAFEPVSIKPEDDVESQASSTPVILGQVVPNNSFVAFESSVKELEEGDKSQASSTPVILGQVVPKNSFVAFESSLDEIEEEAESQTSSAPVILGQVVPKNSFVAFESSLEGLEEDANSQTASTPIILGQEVPSDTFVAFDEPEDLADDTFSTLNVPEKFGGAFSAEVPNVILRHSNCSNISKEDMSAVASVYPHVIINCELEKSTLIPKEIYGPNAKSDVDNDFTVMMFNKGKMEFLELVSVAEKNFTTWKQPILSCVRPRSVGKGSFETSVSLASLLRMTGEISKGFKFFSSGISASGSFEMVGEWTYSVACNYENAAVRPVAEISTMIIKERVREWKVDLGSQDFLKLGEWSELDSVKIYPNSIMLSCVSEQQVPDICSWSDADIQKEVEKNLFDNI